MLSLSSRTSEGSARKFFRLSILILSVVLFSTSTALHFTHKESLSQFFISLLGLIPVSVVVQFAAKDITLNLQQQDHELLSGLFFGIIGNCAELCFAITATILGKPAVAQTALTGSIISHCLMTFGTCLLFGGIWKEHQTYPIIFARTNAQLLVVSLISIILPTAFATWSEHDSLEGSNSLIGVSHGCAIVLLFEFVSYTLFFYHTHVDAKNHDDAPPFDLKLGIMQATSIPAAMIPGTMPSPSELRSLRTAAQDATPRYPVYVSVIILIPGIAVQIFTSIYILESIESSVEHLHVSHSFVGLVMIPLILSSVEHITAAVRSRTEGLAWVTGLAFGSCIRITQFVFPVAVLIGWVANIPGVTMIFDGFQVTILALTIFLVNHVIQNQSLRWIEGTLLLSSFLLFTIAVWHYPNHA